MNSAVYGKTMENFRNRIGIKLVSNKKDNLEWAFKPSYMSHEIFDNDLVAIRKNEQMYEYIIITLKTNMVTTQDYYYRHW